MPAETTTATADPRPGQATLCWERWCGIGPEVRPAAQSHHLSRFLVLRLLGLVYFTAFLVFVRQGLPLLGADGLLPVVDFTARVTRALGSTAAAFERLPSLFWFGAGDGWMLGAAWAGAALSLLVVAGLTNAVAMALLWALYMSFVHVGQDWYGYGWEIQLLETGFLAVFLAPVASLGPFPAERPAPVVVALLRWLVFRIMLGAGLIKLRGDSCWRDFTCLRYHYETQPLPNPLSRTLHRAPAWVATAGVAVNHLTEVVAPWLLALGVHATRVAGCMFVAFQLLLVSSGNLSFLNWLTIVPALACFDDAFLSRVMPRRLAAAARAAEARAAARSPHGTGRLRMAVVTALAGLVAWLSVPVVRNLASGGQVMNTSFGALDLVNTYGAFGTVGRERRVVTFEGSDDGQTWKEYELPCAPGDPARRPCVISPYHERLDWQLWFAAMSTPEHYPWSLHLVWKLLHDDPGTLSLFAVNPFPASPPRYVRARLYTYRFADPASGQWWTREALGDWIPPLAADDPRLLAFLDAYGWRLDAHDWRHDEPARPAEPPR